MSFVNLMESVIWSPADIAARVRAEIRARVSQEAELKAARLARKANRTAEDQAYIDKVDALVDAALAEGAKSLEDMELLTEVLAIEEGTLQLETASEKAQLLTGLRRAVPEDAPGAEGEGEL